jgi:hypothetical protein
MPAIKCKTTPEKFRTKEEFTEIVAAERKVSRSPATKLYNSGDPKKDARKLIKPKHMLYGGEGRFKIPGLQKSRLYTEKTEIEEIEETPEGPSQMEIIAQTLELNQKLTKTKALAMLAELSPDSDLSKDSSKAEIISAIVMMQLELN